MQVQELTLALRRLSDKLDATEQKLLERNEELALSRNERDAARYAEESALELVQKLHVDLEEHDVTSRPAPGGSDRFHV